MGRTFAGILGPLALVTVVARGFLDGGSVESTLQVGCACLFVFAAVGWILGKVAAYVVDESVKAAFDAEIAAAETEQPLADGGATE